MKWLRVLDVFILGLFVCVLGCLLVVLVRADDLWHEESVNANVNWVVPEGKVYEVYVYVPTGKAVVDLNTRVVVYSRYSMWYPSYFCFTFDPTSGLEVDQGSKASSGWIMTGGEGLKCSNSWWIARWRDVTPITVEEPSRWYHNPSNVAYVGLGCIVAGLLVFIVWKKSGAF